MRNFKWVFFVALAAIAGSVVAAQVSVDEDYMQVMEDRQKSLANNIAQQNADGATEDAKELEVMFKDVIEFYAAKGKEDAINWARESEGLAVAINKYVASNDYDTAATTAIALAKTCKSCHRVYKQPK